ncbi:MAG: hypothetical protein PHG00_04550 [Methylococcales bacterium]|nr:hypothetical protein [Methylococcales bacterium]
MSKLQRRVIDHPEKLLWQDAEIIRLFNPSTGESGCYLSINYNNVVFKRRVW